MLQKHLSQTHKRQIHWFVFWWEYLINTVWYLPKIWNSCCLRIRNLWMRAPSLSFFVVSKSRRRFWQFFPVSPWFPANSAGDQSIILSFWPTSRQGWSFPAILIVPMRWFRGVGNPFLWRWILSFFNILHASLKCTQAGHYPTCWQALILSGKLVLIKKTVTSPCSWNLQFSFRRISWLWAEFSLRVLI